MENYGEQHDENAEHKIIAFTFAKRAEQNVLANDWLLMTYPVNNAMLMTQAERIELHFNTPVTLQTLELVAENGVVTRPSLESSVTASLHIMIPVPLLKPGFYVVRWQAEGEKGEQIDGVFHFWQH